MQLRLGINTCFAVKRWPRPEDWGPVVRDRLGLRLVQHSLDLVVPSVHAAVETRSRIVAQGLELHSSFTGLAAYSESLLLHPEETARDAAEAWFGWAIGWTANAGAIATGGHLGAFSVADWNDPGARRTRWGQLQASLDTMAGFARQKGLEYLVVENLAAAREPSTMAMVRELLTDGDADRVPVRLCLDVGHMCVSGSTGDDRDPFAWLRLMGRDAPMIQLQQSDAEGDHHWPFTPARNAIGRIDADRVIDALGEGGVESSALILEVIPAFEQPDDDVLDDLVASVEYWRESLDRRGVLAS